MIFGSRDHTAAVLISLILMVPGFSSAAAGLDEIRDLVRRDSLPEAAEACEAFVAANPGDLEALRLCADLTIRLAESQRNRGDLDAALAALERAGEVATDGPTLASVVRVLLDTGLEKRAADAANEALLRYPADPAVLEWNAAVLSEMNRDDEAAAWLRRSLDSGARVTAWTINPYFREKRLREPYRSLLNGDALAGELALLDPPLQADRLTLLAGIMEPRWVPTVVETLVQTDDNEVARRGLAALAALPEPPLQAVQELLVSGDVGLRRQVLREIWQRRDPAFLGLVREHSHRETAQGNRALAEILTALLRAERLPDAEAISRLESLAAESRFGHLALHALAEIYAGQGEAGRAAEARERALQALPVLSPGDEEETSLEIYWECMQRRDIREILELLEHHRNVRRIDARIYGLPQHDFDDQQNLTISERLFLRSWARKKGLRWPTSGEIQYPREIRHTLREIYRRTGMVPDCSGLLGDPDDPFTKAMVEDGAEIKLYNDTGTDNEVNIVVNPYDQRYVFATSNAYSSNGNETYRSSDWGNTWTHGSAPPGNGACDPVSYYNSSEILYHCWLDGGIHMAWSSDHGASWTNCTSLESSGMDRQDIYIETFEGNGSDWQPSPCLNKIYTGYHAWGQQILKVSTGSSAPYCNSWSGRVNLSGNGSSSTIGTAITSSIGKNTGSGRGTVFFIFSRYSSPAGIYYSTSTNCGSTLSTPALISSTHAGVFEWGIPSACSRKEYIYPQADSDRQPLSPFRNNIYVVWNDLSSSCTPPGCTGNTTCNSDIYVAVGTPNNRDNPTSWSWSTTNLTRDEVGSDLYTDEFYPSLSVDPADGSVYVTYYRSNSGAGGNLTARQKQVHYVALRSTDGGGGWEDVHRVTNESSNEYDSGANSAMQWGDYTWTDAVNGVFYPCWTDRREVADEDIWASKVCTEPAHWSERGTTPAKPPTTATPGATQQIDITWTAPDLYWGDGGENDSQRKYQLYVDGSLHQDNIPWTGTSTTYNASDCTTQHSFRVRAVNQCGTYKDYGTAFATATCGATYGISGHVETDTGSAMQGVTISASGGHTVQTDSGGNYTISGLGNGSYTVSADYPGYTFSPVSYDVNISGSSVTGRDFTGTAVAAPSILFVDDDAGRTYETYFTNALQALGELFDTVTVASGANGPSAATLGGYEVVIWNTGYDYSTTLTATDESSLATYLNGGGRLFLSSQDYLYDRGSQSTFDTNYLHLAGYTDDTKASSLTGVGGDPIGDGISYTASYPSGFTDYTDKLTPGSGAAAVLNKSGTSDCAALRYSDATYRVVFFATPFEAIPAGANPNNRTAVMDRILDWLRASVGAYSISGTILDGSYSGVGGVTVNLSGAATDSVSTAADGSYNFSGLSDGSYTVTPSQAGCTFTPGNRSVSISGGGQAGVNFLADCPAPTYTISGTVSGDTQAGVTVSLGGDATGSTTTNATGYYAFGGIENGSYTVTPAKSGYTFSPASRPVTVSGSDRPGQDFTATATGGCSDRTATYDAGFGSPACTSTGRSCDAPTSLLQCTGASGEPNPPNTLDGCADGTSGTCSSDESIDGITIAATDGTSCLAPGVEVEVTVTTYCYSASDYVTLFYSTSATAPSWTKVGSTQKAPGSGERTFQWVFTLSGTADTAQALRAQMVYSTDPGTNACYSGSYNDRDDLVFMTGSGGPSTYAISGTVSGDVQSGVTLNLTGDATDTTTTGVSGFYEFTDVAEGSYTVTPSLAGYTFSPTSRAVTVSGSDRTGQDFTSTALGGGLDCASPVILADNVPYSSSTTGGDGNVTTYGCSSWNESGPEVVHQVTTAATGDIVATLSGMSVDLDVFILSGCDEDACQAYGDSTATWSDAPAGTYYVVVDGYNGAAGSYTLTVDFDSGAPVCSDLTATYSVGYQCPACASDPTSCFTGTLVDGVRLSESNYPNTIDDACADGSNASSTYEYIRDIKVETTDATCINAGDEIKMTVYFNIDDAPNDYIDFYYTSNADAAFPTWVLKASARAEDYFPGATGIRGLNLTFNLDAVPGNHAVRGQIRWQSSAASCSTGSYDDHDDLVFPVSAAKSSAAGANR